MRTIREFVISRLDPNELLFKRERVDLLIATGLLSDLIMLPLPFLLMVIAHNVIQCVVWDDTVSIVTD